MNAAPVSLDFSMSRYWGLSWLGEQICQMLLWMCAYFTEIHDTVLCATKWTEVSISSHRGQWNLIKYLWRSYCEAHTAESRECACVDRAAQRRREQNKECMNDGGGQYDSVHHASFSTAALLCQAERGGYQWGERYIIASFTHSQPTGRAFTETGSSQRCSSTEWKSDASRVFSSSLPVSLLSLCSVSLSSLLYPSLSASLTQSSPFIFIASFSPSSSFLAVLHWPPLHPQIFFHSLYLSLSLSVSSYLSSSAPPFFPLQTKRGIERCLLVERHRQNTK